MFGNINYYIICAILGEVCYSVHAKSYPEEGKIWHNGPEHH